MSVRRLVVEVDASTINVTEFCRQHQISTWWFYEQRRRFKAEGDVGLEPRSRAPHLIANKTPIEVEEAIVAKRKELADGGFDAGPASIVWHLRHLDGLPSESTIWRILSARGHITPEPNKAPKPKGRRFQAERANESWQLDDTPWQLADGTEVKILNVVDDHSRLAVASVALASTTGAATLDAVATGAQTLGWPARFQSDNAKAFRDVLAEALAELGIAAAHSRPYHPQTNGKVERFHQTVKRWLAKQPGADTLAELQTQLDIFRHHYNHLRPHRSLNRDHPAHVWTNAPKTGPAGKPLGATTRTHHGTVTSHAYISATNRYQISLGTEHAGKTHLTIVTGTNCHVFINGKLVRALTLDPNKRNQGLYDHAGRPPRLP